MLLISLALLSTAAPNDPWRTIRTEHYVVHYPADAEEWATAAASRLEAIRERTEKQIGWELDKRVTVVLRDPYAASNGMAIPFLARPRTELWLTAPGAASPIGWNRRWDEGLIVHEDAHLVHLSRPARGGLDTLLDKVLRVGPVARKSPRWVAEGYATVVEGDQTGFGRPFAAAEQAAIRRLATDGALPTYGELDGTARWGGRSFAYGIGAAYLRWLRDRAGPDSLRALWARMSATENRSFEQAFRGVFGDDPDALYGRWAAETTLAAMALEETRPPVTTTRWLDLSKGVGAPALSPNGERLALVQTEDDRPVLSVYRIAPRKDAEIERTKEVDALLKADPADVPDRPTAEPDLHDPVQRTRRDRAPAGVQWLDDDHLLLASRVPDRDGRQRWDLFVWNRKTDEERRVTRRADVSDAHPAPDGSFAIGVQQRWGATCLARVDLNTGETTCLTPQSVDVVVDSPRIDAAGERVLWLEQRNGPWTLMVGRLTPDGLAETRPLRTPALAQLATPTWHPDGDRIVASLGWDAFMDIAEIPVDGGEVQVWTRSHGGAVAPTVGDGQVFWLDQDSRGYDVHRADLPMQTEPLPDPSDAPSLAVLPRPPVVPELSRTPVTSTAYGLGRTEAQLLVEATTGRQEAYTAGIIRLGDIVGRHEALLRAGRAARPAGSSLGLRATWVLRSGPSDVELDSFVGADDGTWDLWGGGGLRVRDRHRWAWGRLDGDVGGYGTFSPSSKDRVAAGHTSGRLRMWEPTQRWISLDAEAATTIGALSPGDPGAWVRSYADLGLLRDAVHLKAAVGGTVGGAPDLGLGGAYNLFLPDAAQRGVILDPALPRGTPGGSQYLGLQATLGRPEAGVWIRRHRIGDRLNDVGAYTLLGASTSVEQRAQPFVGLPAFTIDVGLSCQLENPTQGFVDRPLRNIDNWALWTGVRWGL